jgi:RecA/RadA recombinase
MARAKVVEEVPVKRTRRTKVEEVPVKRTRRAKVEVAEEAPVKRTRRTKAVEEVPATKAGKRAAIKSEAVAFFNPLAGIDEELDGIEKDYSLTGSSLDLEETCMSTSMLGLDLILSKGLRPGWYTFVGGEQSCKSTCANTVMVAATGTEVPVVAMWDYEGSTDAAYLENMMQVNHIGMPISEIFGVRDPKSNKWAIAPRVRYYSEGVAEKFFDYLAKLERILPDKIKMGDQWYYVYDYKVMCPKTNKMIVSKKNAAIVGSHYDKEYLKKTGKYRIPAQDGTMQAVLILDSLPAMLPERLDKDDAGSGMAAQARMFSEQMKRVKGKMKSKRIAVLAVNQLRKAPMVMFGNPEYEPCGEAPKYFSDVRLYTRPRVANAAPGNSSIGKGMIEEERGIDGGVDKYRYIHIRAHKNKLSVPNLEGWLRLWITDSKNQARGMDPVWDTYRYLMDTGQATGKRNALKFTIKGHETPAMKWLQLKTLVLGTKKQIRETCEALGVKAFDVRAFCKNQLANGDGLERYFTQKNVDVDAEDSDSAITPDGADEE